MRTFTRVLRTSVARGIAVMCAAVFVTSAHTAQAGINVWTSHGPPGENVRALVIDPITPRTLYAVEGDGFSNGGIFKSTDAGTTWSPANEGLSNGVTALAIDPVTPSTLYAAAFTIINDDDENTEAFSDIFKSTDAGASWGKANGVGDATEYIPIYALVIDPLAPSTLYAVGGGGVSKSTDAGASWGATDLPLTNGVTALAINPVTPRTLYAGTGYAGVFKSTDAGVTWGAAGTGLTRAVLDLVFDPTTPSTLYAGTDYYRNRGAVYRSTDAGATWRIAQARIYEGPSHTVRALAIDPVSPGTLYAGTDGGGIFKSTDGGGTWRALNAGLSNTHVTALAIDPIMPSTLHAGTSGGGVFSIQQVTCTGDCDGDGTVTVDDLVTGVNIVLGTLPLGACPSFDAGDDVTIDDVIAAVTNALNGCPTEGME